VQKSFPARQKMDHYTPGRDSSPLLSSSTPDGTSPATTSSLTVGADPQNGSSQMMRPLSQHYTILILAQDNVCTYFIVIFVPTLREDFSMLIMILLGPLELVSPILEFTNGSSFRRQVEHVWGDLDENTKISVNNKSCGTHIHLSPQNSSGTWTLGAVKAICRSIVYFEFAFEALLPPH